jgi:hypothetical protein
VLGAEAAVCDPFTVPGTAFKVEPAKQNGRWCEP